MVMRAGMAPITTLGAPRGAAKAGRMVDCPANESATMKKPKSIPSASRLWRRLRRTKASVVSGASAVTGLAAMVTGKSGSQDTATRRAGLVFPERSPHDRRVLLTNARVYSMAESVPAARSSADTLLIQDGRIVFCGRRSEENPPAAEPPAHPGGARARRRAEVTPPAAEPTLDLGGRAVLPGLVDGHGHLMHLARARLTLDVSG